MIESGRKLNELEGKLNSNNRKIISDAIISLRNTDPYRGAIGLLSGHFDTTDDVIIRDLISNFLNDIKELDARTEVVAELRKAFKQETIRMLVSSCWQSGLDYSDYAGDFVNIFIRGDYITALECFTVIEESAGSISVSVKNDITKRLEKSIKTSSPEKVSLTEALLVVLCRG